VKVKSHRDLIAWQKGMDLACQVYHLSAEFPREEAFGLVRDVRDSAVSIPSNIAEGQARTTRDFKHFLTIALGSLQELETTRDFKHFLTIGLGSLQELETQLLLAERLGMAGKQSMTQALETSGDVARLIRGLSSSLG